MGHHETAPLRWGFLVVSLTRGIEPGCFASYKTNLGSAQRRVDEKAPKVFFRQASGGGFSRLPGRVTKQKPLA